MQVQLEYFDGTDWQIKEVELDPETDFTISPENIEVEMVRIASLLQYYGDLSSELRAQASRRKADIDNTYVEQALKERAAATEKMTDARIKEKAYNTTEYKRACYQHIEADRLSRKIEGFYRSLSKVADLLIAICYKQNNELKRMGAM